MRTKKQKQGDMGEFMSRLGDELSGYKTESMPSNNKGYDYKRKKRSL